SYNVVIVDRDANDLPVEELARRMRVRHPEVAMVVVATTFDARRSPYEAWIERPYRPAALPEVVRTASIARERRCGRTTASCREPARARRRRGYDSSSELVSRTVPVFVPLPVFE